MLTILFQVCYSHRRNDDPDPTVDLPVSDFSCIIEYTGGLPDEQIVYYGRTEYPERN